MPAKAKVTKEMIVGAPSVRKVPQGFCILN